MLCKKLTGKLRAKIKYPVYVQEKIDGVRCTYSPSKGLRTRAGNSLHIATVERQLHLLDRFMRCGEFLDGEITFFGKDRAKGNGLALKAQNNNLSVDEQQLCIYTVWDLYKPQTEYCFRYVDLRHIVDYLPDRLPVRAISNNVAHGWEDIEYHYSLVRRLSGEGVVIKDPNAYYVHDRTSACLKWKNESTITMRAIQISGGEGKYSGCMGSIFCVTDDNKIGVWVGSGFVDDDRIDIDENWEDFDGQLLDVKYQQVIPASGNQFPYTLALPIFSHFRDDIGETSKWEDVNAK